MTRYVLLVRHAAIGREETGRFIGQTDLPLSAEGEQQSLRLRETLEGWSITAAFCSDLVRTRQTALIALAGRDIPIVPLRGLREASMGLWEGKIRSEIAEAFPEDFAARGADLAGYRIPGGETFAECQARVAQTVRAIVETVEGNILVVAHANTNRLLLCSLLGLAVADMFTIRQDYCGINVISLDEAGGATPLLLNSMGWVPIPEGEDHAIGLFRQQRHHAGVAAGGRGHDAPLCGGLRQSVLDLPAGA